MERGAGECSKGVPKCMLWNSANHGNRGAARLYSGPPPFTDMSVIRLDVLHLTAEPLMVISSIRCWSSRSKGHGIFLLCEQGRCQAGHARIFSTLSSN